MFVGNESDEVKMDLECSRCSEKYQLLSELEIHLATDHLSFTPYQCVYCSYVRLPSVFALKQHYNCLHANKDLQV